jgi:short-subunit dehydrogenase involved in D-alanine esterification of teichoic acids
MKTTGNTVFISGGGSGIGLALAESLLDLGNRVMICGRDSDKLTRAKERHPDLDTLQCDISRDEDLRRAVAATEEAFGGLTLLVNNAGVQFNYRFADDDQALAKVEQEVAINFLGHVKLTRLMLPLLLRQEEAALVNVTSVLGLVAKESAPIYGATKAALRQFTQVLRYQLEGGPLWVFEVVPPLVDTAMTAGRGRGKMPPEAAARGIIEGLRRDVSEIRLGKAKLLFVANRLAPGLVARIVRRF